MCSMQMTGYMFRNAEYRRSLLESLDQPEGLGGGGGGGGGMLGAAQSALPPVSGKIKVRTIPHLGGGRQGQLEAIHSLTSWRRASRL